MSTESTDIEKEADLNKEADTDKTKESDNEIKDKSDKDLSPELKAMFEKMLDEQLKDIKGKLDKAYGARDDALKQLKQKEQAEKEAEIKRLQDEGKVKEALELQLSEERAKIAVLEKRNTELARDNVLKDTLIALNFRNDKAREMAAQEIVGQLVQNEQGVWIHKTGVSIKDFITAFAEDEANSFLFKPKQSSGAGVGSNKSGNPDNKPKSVFEMSQDEVLKRAAEGTLRR